MWFRDYYPDQQGRAMYKKENRTPLTGISSSTIVTALWMSNIPSKCVLFTTDFFFLGEQEEVKG